MLDAVQDGERRYGETYAQAVEATGYGVEALKNAKWVAERYEPSTRVDVLCWSHHREAAALPACVSRRRHLLRRARHSATNTRGAYGLYWPIGLPDPLKFHCAILIALPGISKGRPVVPEGRYRPI